MPPRVTETGYTWREKNCTVRSAPTVQLVGASYRSWRVMLSHAPTPARGGEAASHTQPPIKRSHSPDDTLTSSDAKRRRPSPPLADAYLASLGRDELVALIRRIEACVSSSPVADEVRAIIYPANMAERVAERSAPSTTPGVPDAPVGRDPTPAQTPDRSTDLGTPARTALPPHVYTPSIPPRDAPSSNISTRIAAILDSLNTSNGGGPMLGPQGQPLAPARQAGTSGLSSLLSNSSILSRPREDTPAAQGLPLRTEGGIDLSRVGGPTFDTPFTTTPGVQHSAVATHPATGAAYMPAKPHAHDGGIAREHRITSTLPSYEDMIVEGLQAIGDVNGTPPRMLFHWMEDTYPLMKNFRPSASQALQKAFKRGRLHKVGSLYRINPDWDGSNTGRKPTRRPQIGKDHPMMVNGPKGPAPASPFKARAQFQGAAAYRQVDSPLTRPRGAPPRIFQGLRPGPKPYGQPGAAPLDNPASGIFQNGAAAAALLLAHQQRRAAGGSDAVGELTPTLMSLVQQLRSSSGDENAPPLTGVLANALLKHAQAGDRPAGQEYSSPVMQSLSRLLGARRTPGVFPPSGPGSLSASIESLMHQATQTAQPDVAQPPPPPSGDIDAAVSKTLEAAFQQIDTPGEEQAEGGIDLSDYGDALRTLTAALGNTEDEQHLADERAIAEAEADHEDGDGDEEDEDSSNNMTTLLQSYGIQVSPDELQQLTAGLQGISEAGTEGSAEAPAESVGDGAHAPDASTEGIADTSDNTGAEGTGGEGAAADGEDGEDASANANQAIQSQLEALIASLAAGAEPEGSGANV